jgi:hypothetical protein
MHSFSVVSANSAATNMERFCVLNKSVGKYLAEEFDLLKFEGYVALGQNQYISLHHLSLMPSLALKRMGCETADDLVRASAYACGFSGVTRHCLVPLGILTPMSGLRKYAEAFEKYVGEGSSSYLHVLSDDTRFYGYNLFEPQESATDPMNPWPERRYDVTRFEQIYAGSGYTHEMLAAGHRDMALRPVRLNLSNEDILLAYVYQDLSA